MSKNSFTLIELLIVVAIIGILAAIAIPNFFQAMIRAKIARVHADLHTYATACEEYRIDHNTFPWPLIEARRYDAFSPYVLFELTTPTAYLNNADGIDPFNDRKTWKGREFVRDQDDPWYFYSYYQGYFTTLSFSAQFANKPNGYTIQSFGPDRVSSGGYLWPLYQGRTDIGDVNRYIYDTSNGLLSSGDIVRFGGEVNAPVSMGN